MSRPDDEKRLIRACLAGVAMHAMICADKPFAPDEIAKLAWKQADELMKREDA